MDEDRFKKAEDEYFRLKGQLAAGRITAEQFEVALKDLMIEDTQGRYWMLGADSGQWYVHDGQAWVQAEPPRGPTTPLPVLGECPHCGEPVEEDALFCGNCGQRLAESVAAPLPPPPPPPAQKKGIPRIVLGLVLLLGVVSVVLLAAAIALPQSPVKGLLAGKPATPTLETVWLPTTTPLPTLPPTATPAPTDTPTTAPSPTATPESPVATPVSTTVPTNTPSPPATPVPSTDTPVPPTATLLPPPTPTAMPTATPLLSTPTATPVAAKPGVITDFEVFGTWRRGDEPHGTFSPSSAQVHGGSYAGRLDYNLPGGDRNYVVFMQSHPLSGQPNAIRIWVYEDGFNHFLNVWIKDAAGERWQASFGRLSGQGWTQKQALIQTGQPWPWGHIDGPDNGQVHYPISFNALVLDDPTKAASRGTIYLDDLTYGQVQALPPTATPTPQPSVGGGPYAAPRLVSPPDEWLYKDDEIKLVWEWTGQLGSGEHFDVGLWFGGQPRRGVGVTDGREFTIRKSDHRTFGPGWYHWNVWITRDLGGGRFEVLAESEERAFNWID